MGSSFLKMFRGRGQQDPLDDPKHAHAFLQAQPPNDPLGLLEAVVGLLEERGASMALMSPSRVQALLVLDRGSLVAQAAVLLQYRAPNISDEARRRLWHASNDFARWFAHAYERASAAYFSAADGKGASDRANAVPLHGIYSRMFHYRGAQAKLGLFRHESWIPGSWKVLHDAYRQALARTDPGEPFGLDDNAGESERVSAEQEFIEVLLLQRVNSGNLSIEEVECAANWLTGWSQRLKLEKAPPSGDGFWLDLNRSEGLLADRPPAAPDGLLYLDVGPLHQQLSATIGRLSVQLGQPGNVPGSPELRAASEQLKLARRLDPLWRPHAEHRPRRGERRPERGTVTVAAGWSSIAAAMPSASSSTPESTRGYSFDDVSSVAIYGATRNLAGDRFGSTIQKDPDRHEWQMHDASDSGVRIMSSTREAQKQQIGALVALRVEGDPRWQVGIVRRLRRRTAEHTELGIEIIAPQVQMMLVTRGGSRDGGFTGDTVSGATQSFSALDLRPQVSGKPAIRSMILQAIEYTPGRRLTINVNGVQKDIRLFAPLEQTREWVWTAYEVVNR